MLRSCLSARLRIAPSLAAALVAGAAFALIGLSGSPASAAPKDLRWATGPQGSSGGRALVVLANVLNKYMPEYRITVLPTPGAVTTVKGFALGNYDGYYGSDVAMREFKADKGRFKGFRTHIKRLPVQSLWCYTLDVGLAIKASNMGQIKTWNDLTGKPVYTGPPPFDTRKHLANAMHDVGVKHIYRNVDVHTAGSQLNSGAIKGMIIYAAGGRTPPGWLSQASLAVDWAALNPSPKEEAELKAKGYVIEHVPAAHFGKRDHHVKTITLLPFYWGFHVGLNVPENEMYKMLNVVEAHANEMAKEDSAFRQIANGNFAKFEHKTLETTWNLVPIHPGLAKYLKEKGLWDKKWDANIAK